MLLPQETAQATVPASAPAPKGITSAPAPPHRLQEASSSASTATRNLLVILHGRRVEDELLRNALLEAKQQGHQVRCAPLLVCSRRKVTPPESSARLVAGTWQVHCPPGAALPSESSSSSSSLIPHNHTRATYFEPTISHQPDSLLATPQVTVRVTFDRGDVEHFVSEAIRLNDAGAASYQTIVAGGPLVQPWSQSCSA